MDWRSKKIFTYSLTSYNGLRLLITMNCLVFLLLCNIVHAIVMALKPDAQYFLYRYVFIMQAGRVDSIMRFNEIYAREWWY